MGVASAETTSDTAADMTTAKPRERQFQVVPVPGKFTRGRWQCWDYRDDKPDASDEILDFTDKAEKNAPAPAPTTLPVATEVPSTTIAPQSTLNDTLAVHTLNDPAPPPPSLLIAQQGVPVGAGGGIAPLATQAATDLVVTSPSVHDTIPTSVAAAAAAAAQAPLAQAQAVAAAPVAAAPVAVVPSSSQSQMAHRESSTIVVTSIAPAPVTPVHGTPSSSLDIDSGLSANIANLQGTTNANAAALSRQPSAASFLDGGGAASSTAVTTTLKPLDGGAGGGTVDDSSSSSAAATTSSVPGAPNVVAIDNKIEQAMDLVKTHLTFAVREEVEILRSTIVDLEAKVAQLESQNQVLKQFAPAEVVANLALLVQSAQQQKQLQQQMQQAQNVAAAAVSVTGNAVVQPITSSAQPVIVNAQPIGHTTTQQLPTAVQSQSLVGVMSSTNTATTSLISGVDTTNVATLGSSSLTNAPDILSTTLTSAHQLSSSTLNSMAANVDSHLTNTTTSTSTTTTTTTTT